VRDQRNIDPTLPVFSTNSKKNETAILGRTNS
jgi:hypothetical protein